MKGELDKKEKVSTEAHETLESMLGGPYDKLMQYMDEQAKATREAEKTLERILSKTYENFDQYAEVSKIEDLEVAKMVIKRLLDRING